MAAATGQYGVYAAQHVGGGLDFAGVHGEQHAGRPVEHAVVDAGAYGFDDFAGQAVVVCFGCRFVESYVLEEDGEALDGLSAAGALGGGELEGVDDC